ncbi:MAG TPA: DUF5709 domain-containing protein [Pseudonocardiaceae bacterium]|jgi:hypothetical protein|nr:DUF5709 domain-containing protein [Pseudonocardiaceae bacterium]
MPRQHDYEPQPEAPDLGASVQLETSESLVAPPGADGLDAGYVPPDRPYLLDERRVTAAELSEPETLDERLARERPDVLQSPEQIADIDDTRAGRITPAEADPDGEPANSVEAIDAGIDGGAASAEEAAMRVVERDRIAERPEQA